MEKLMGQDKGSLTEQQTKGTVTTTTTLRRKKYTKQTVKSTEQLSLPDALRAPELQLPSSLQPAPPAGTQHDGTWY